MIKKPGELDLIKEAEASIEQSFIDVRENDCNCQGRILIVDDTEFNIIPIKSMLVSIYKVPVETANNGKIAVDMYKEAVNRECRCEQRAYKLIIMDLGMPVMGGEEATIEILKLMPKPQLGEEELTHIVACTSFTNEKTWENCLKIGMKKVYTKPLKLHHLEEIMQSNFSRKKNEWL